MKTFSKIFAYAAVAAFALSSCTSEKLKNDELNSGKTVTVHFGAENTEPSTKATLTPDTGETAFEAAWESGDVLSVYYLNNNYQEGTISATWDGSSFKAKLPEYTGEWTYDAAYPVPDAIDSHVDFGSDRTQKGNAYNSKYDIMIGSAYAKDAAAGKDDSRNDIIFKMDRQTAIAYFHFTSDLNEAITSATLTVSGYGAAIASSSAYVNNFVWEPTKDRQSITITFPEEAPNAQDFKLWFNVLPTKYETMSLTVETATKTFTISKSTKGEYVKGRLYKVKKENIEWTPNWSKTYTSNVDISGAKVIIDNIEYKAFQVGSSKNSGSKTFKVPANTTKLYLHVVGWKDEDSKIHTISTSVGTISSSSITTKTDTGATDKSPFTLSSKDYSSSNYFYEFTLSGVTSEATITISNSAKKERGLYFGINAE